MFNMNMWKVVWDISKVILFGNRIFYFVIHFIGKVKVLWFVVESKIISHAWLRLGVIFKNRIYTKNNKSGQGRSFQHTLTIEQLASQEIERKGTQGFRQRWIWATSDNQHKCQAISYKAAYRGFLVSLSRNEKSIQMGNHLCCEIKFYT